MPQHYKVIHAIILIMAKSAEKFIAVFWRVSGSDFAEHSSKYLQLTINFSTQFGNATIKVFICPKSVWSLKKCRFNAWKTDGLLNDNYKLKGKKDFRYPDKILDGRCKQCPAKYDRSDR